MKLFYTKSVKWIAAAILFVISAFNASANTYTVTNTNATGTGSLADAILQSNFNAGRDIINFNIAGSGPFIINPGDYFPNINDGVFINGYSQPGSAAGPINSRTILIVLDGTALPYSVDALNIRANNVEISGLCIHNFGQSGIKIQEVNDTFIWGCFIGTDNTGNITNSNGRHGIFSNLYGSLYSNNTIIGTNGDGTNDANEGNLISGNNESGIVLTQANNSKISGNFIGVTASGIASLPNNKSGIILQTLCANNLIGTNGDGTSDALEKNIVGNNGENGIDILNEVENTKISGNSIGLDLLNNVAANNFGIFILNSSNCLIGTNADGNSDAAEANVISGNTNFGIWIKAGNSGTPYDKTIDNISIAGNFIGAYPGEVLPKGNTRMGIFMEVWSGKNIQNINIGSNNDGVNDNVEANVIANNAEDGIATFSGFSAGGVINSITVSRNRFYNNGGLSIDWRQDETGNGTGVNNNDNADVDAGTNGYFNTPVITNIADGGSTYIITGFCQPGAIIEWYGADAGPNPNPTPSGFTKDFGEGQNFIIRVQEGTTLNGITDADNTTGSYTKVQEGNNNPGTITENKFEFAIDKSLFAGISKITATATENTTGSTSEFGGVFTSALLPIQLLSFNAVATSGKVTVQWKTAREVNASHYDVLRSEDGRNFSKIGTVPANNVGGSYTLADANPKAKNFYRLQQFDKDAQSTFSKIVFVRLDDASVAIRVSPNPFVDNVNISFNATEAGIVHVRIIDQIGRPVKVYNFTAAKGTNFFNLSNINTLTAGQYVIDINGKNINAQKQIIKY